MVRVTQPRRLARVPGRAGFTLPELLVVISILAILALLSTAVVLNFGNTGPQKATQAQLRSIKSKLDTQWKAVRDKAQEEPIPPTLLSSVQTLAGATSPADPRVRAKYIELKLTQAFPQSIAEALNPTPLAPWAPYKTYLNGLGISAGNATTTPNEVAMCLLMALEHGPRNTGVSADELLTLTMPVSGTIQGRGLVDGWRRPLVFSRNAGSQPPTPVIMSAGADGALGGATFSLATLANDNSPAFKDNLSSANVP